MQKLYQLQRNILEPFLTESNWLQRYRPYHSFRRHFDE